MKKLSLAIATFLFSAMLFAQTYTVICVYGANGSRTGRAKLNKTVPVSVGTEIKDSDNIELKNGSYIELDNGFIIKESGKVKDVIVDTSKSTNNTRS